MSPRLAVAAALAVVAVAAADTIPAARASAAREKAASATEWPARACSANTRASRASLSAGSEQPSAGQPWDWAQRTIAGPLAYSSTQPHPPHGQGSPCRSITVCPMWPALPVGPA